MPTFMQIGSLIRAPEDIDTLRLRFLKELNAYTGRSTLVYEQNARSGSMEGAVSDADISGLMETLFQLPGPGLDLILHSQGGSPDAADMVVSYLREKFTHLRVYVPEQAMSAATMIACGADEIVLARHSFLGPIDLQVYVDGGHVAAQDVLDQYELIKADYQARSEEFWMGPGRLYHPNLLVRCRNALEYGQEVAERYLRTVMFAAEPDAAERAKRIAEDLADHRKHKDHGRRLPRKYLRDLGLRVVDLESDQRLQDLVLSVHHCFQHTFQANPALAKLLQNHNGRFFTTFDPTLLPD